MVVFDLDDTLYLERDYVRSGYRAVAEHLERRGSVASAAVLEDWLWQRFLGGRVERAFDSLNEHFRLGLSGPQIVELVEVYRAHRPDIRPAEGAADMLSRLHAEYRLGLLSDGCLPAQELKLDALKLRRFFDVVMFTEAFGREAWKPSPAGFERIQRQLDVPPPALAYVGDNPAKDFVAPHRLGWLTVQFLRAGQIHAHKPAAPGGEPRTIVRSPGELYVALLGHELPRP